MFWDDIVLVTETVGRYGLRPPFVDIGGLVRPCIADYRITRETGSQNRYLVLSARPFDHIDPGYRIINPAYGDPPLEELPYTDRDGFGTAVCLNVLEHVANPFRAFRALWQIMKRDSLLVVSTVFSFPYHPSPADYWRFTPDALRLLADDAGFVTLECDWRLHVPVEWGVRDLNTGEPQLIRSVYAVLTKGDFTPRQSGPYPLPDRSLAEGDER